MLKKNKKKLIIFKFPFYFFTAQKMTFVSFYKNSTRSNSSQLTPRIKIDTSLKKKNVFMQIYVRNFHSNWLSLLM